MKRSSVTTKKVPGHPLRAVEQKLSGNMLLRDIVEAFTTRKNVYVGLPVREETRETGDEHSSRLEGTGRTIVAPSLFHFLCALCLPYKDGYCYEVSVRRVQWKKVRHKYNRALRSGKKL
jgi:hypothetical protein